MPTWPLRVLLAAALATGPVQAQEIPPPAYQLAAQRAGIPSTVLYAVALQESGVRRDDRIVPWPWSLNVAGQSRRHEQVQRDVGSHLKFRYVIAESRRQIFQASGKFPAIAPQRLNGFCFLTQPVPCNGLHALGRAR